MKGMLFLVITFFMSQAFASQYLTIVNKAYILHDGVKYKTVPTNWSPGEHNLADDYSDVECSNAKLDWYFNWVVLGSDYPETLNCVIKYEGTRGQYPNVFNTENLTTQKAGDFYIFDYELKFKDGKDYKMIDLSSNKHKLLVCNGGTDRLVIKLVKFKTFNFFDENSPNVRPFGDKTIDAVLVKNLKDSPQTVTCSFTDDDGNTYLENVKLN